MTFVEFFDRAASENVFACLAYVPDRVIYIGDNSRRMKKYALYYQRVFENRGYNIGFSFRTVSKSNLDNAVGVITDIVETYDDCVFDITGGEEILNVALGIVYARYPDKNIQIHKFNIRNNKVYDCDKDGIPVYRQIPALSVKENLWIHGADMVCGNVRENDTCNWDMNEDFTEDINKMWSVCKEDVRYWNAVISVFEAAEKTKIGENENSLTTTADLGALETLLSKRKVDFNNSNPIIRKLLKFGLLRNFDIVGGKAVRITYKNRQVKRCLTKSGQALEMKIFSCAKNVLDDDGRNVYNDALNGVVIDWDGDFDDDKTGERYDTENEIDVLLMHGMIPVFVSCKNGLLSAEELYKLNTVAERFGGEYAKKVLVATSLSALGETGGYLRQRAGDMNIRIVEDIQNLDDDGLERVLGNLWRN